MNWFIKVLRHYADFSGRARRTEYWMFTLFYAIFYVALTLIMVLGLLIFSHSGRSPMPITSNIAVISYSCLLGLPGLAVAVRRLHDVGKSGWMLLVVLIPIVGGIWLFVLMLTAGEERGNQYGPDPKLTEESFSDQAKLNSAGVTLIVASAVLLVLTIVLHLIVPIVNSQMFMFTAFLLIQNILSIAATIVLLIAGILLTRNQSIDEIQEEKKNIFFLVLIAVGVFFILSLLNFITIIIWQMRETGWLFFVNSFIYVVFYLFFALFVSSILFSSQNKELIRNLAVLSIVISGICLLWKVIFGIAGASGQDYEYQLQNLFWTYSILLPAAFIVLAGTILSGSEKKKPAPMQGRSYSDSGETAYYEAPSRSGDPGNTVFIREDRKSDKVWRIYKAPSKADALAFLSQMQVNRPYYYLVVETHEGNFGKDIDGIYQE